jgi:RNA polymerase sigma-70 factor (ECF subfamily)
VNGGPGALVTTNGRPFLVFALDIDQTGHRLREIDAVLNPDKLAALFY